VDQSQEAARWLKTPLDLPVPSGFSQAAATATVLDGARVSSVAYIWTGSAGRVSARVRLVDESDLPLDVYLTFPDSPLVVAVQALDSGFVAIEQPRSGPAPGVGYVNIYAEGRLILLESQDLRQDTLLSIGQELLQRSPFK
jgi:hypothetical protein